MNPKIVFITGTDTGVGKTLLTALLLCHLRAHGSCALALKPFCSGSRADAQLLYDLQDRELTLDEINPFYFPEPVAPLVSARKHKRSVPLDQVVRHIHSITSRIAQAPHPSASKAKTRNLKLATQNYLLIEGSGGLLVPLGEGYTVRDVILRLDCEVIVVSRNQLGTINHTLLTTQALRNPISRSTFRTARSQHSVSRTPHSALKVVLMDVASPDSSSASNAAILSELLAPTSLVLIPFVGAKARTVSGVRKTTALVKPALARVLA